MSRRSGLPRRGQNALEFALTLPVFLALVLGLMDYGYLFAMQAGLDNAVSMSCREGSLADSERGQDPQVVAAGEWTVRSSIFCGGGSLCSFSTTDLNSGVDFAVPNRTIRCEGVRNMTPLTGYVPYPSTISSVSFYRLEWQRKVLPPVP